MKVKGPDPLGYKTVKKQIATYIFDVGKTVRFHIVAEPEVIRDLRNYAELHSADDLDVVSFMKRVIFHEAFCYAEPLSLVYHIHVNRFRKAMEQIQRWISYDGFLEAYFLIYPEDAIKPGLFKLEEIIPVLKECHWMEFFDVDIDEVIERLLKHASSGN